MSRTQRKGKVLCKRCSILPGREAEKTKTSQRKQRNKVIICFIGSPWQTGRTRGLTKHLSQEGKEDQDAKHHVRKANIKSCVGCAATCQSDEKYRECIMANNRAYGTMNKWYQMGHRAAKRSQHDAATKTGAIRKPMVSCTDYMQWIPYDTHE